MDVKWIKACDGIGGQPVIDAPWNAERGMKQMAGELQGTDDFLALYITRKCGEPRYRSKICAFVTVPDGAVHGIVRLRQPDYTWNDPGNKKPRWPVSVPICSPWFKIPDHMIDDVNEQCRQAVGNAGWSGLQSALRGKAQPIDRGNYGAVGRVLSRFIKTNQGSLIKVADQGNAGVPPGTHRS